MVVFSGSASQRKLVHREQVFQKLSLTDITSDDKWWRKSFSEKKKKKAFSGSCWQAIHAVYFPNGTQMSFTVKEEIFVGEKFRTFPSKTFRMELNFVLSNWPKPGKLEKTIERPVNHAEEILVWKLVSYIFELYESYEIKFPTKISSFTVPWPVIGLTPVSISSHWAFSYSHQLLWEHKEDHFTLFDFNVCVPLVGCFFFYISNTLNWFPPSFYTCSFKLMAVLSAK